MNLINKKIAVIGLGYVGLPLAVEFANKFSVIGFDIDKNRIKDLKNGNDKTNEVSQKKLVSVQDLTNKNQKIGLHLSNELDDLKSRNLFIITVPTPINRSKAPNLIPLLEASKMIGKIIKKNDIVIYESTVYPGCTEEECVPILEANSGLKFNKDFYCGYSPERINPGDNVNTLTKIKKVTSGSNEHIAETIDHI